MINQSNIYQTLLDKLINGWSGLPDKPEENPEQTLRVLWQYASGNDFHLSQLDNNPLPDLSPNMVKDLESLVDKRITNVPLAYLIGRQLFMGIEFQTGPEAMIPRKETEIIGKLAVNTAKDIAHERGSIFAIDVCTGSGNLALTVAYYVPGCKVIGSDLSQSAVDLATRNAVNLQLDQRVHFIQGDLFEPFKSDVYYRQADLIICNPPYLSSARVDKEPEEIKNFEPRLAFDAGPFGINILTRIAREAYLFLKPGSPLCVEIGSGQGKAMMHLIQKTACYTDLEPFYDELGEIRALKARSIPAIS
jgi:release factor glutamine methyltransferase